MGLVQNGTRLRNSSIGEGVWKGNRSGSYRAKRHHQNAQLNASEAPAIWRPDSDPDSDLDYSLSQRQGQEPESSGAVLIGVVISRLDRLQCPANGFWGLPKI